MGWLYMGSLGGHAGPRQYLDAQFTYASAEGTSRVLRSALVGPRVYYAAVEQVRRDGEREVFGLVCLVHYDPRDRDGDVFGYKDMTENMGPNESECPTSILDLLTPTTRPYAVAWRARCRENAVARKARTARPVPHPGQTIGFEEPLRFADGRSYERLVVIADPRSQRTVLFRDPEQGGLYRIPGIKGREYRLLDPAAV